MFQPKSSVTFFEFTQDDLKLNEIKTEPEVLIENETESQERLSVEETYHLKIEKVESDEKCDTEGSDNQDWVDLDKKYQIKTEKIEICDEESNHFHQDFEDNEKCNIEYVKLENNLNANDAEHLTNTERFKMVTENETSVAARNTLKPALCSFLGEDSSQKEEHSSQMYSVEHPLEQHFPCPHCNYSATAENYLEKHILSEHNHKSKILKMKRVCHLCKKKVNSKYYLKIHMDIMHFNTKKKCPDCDYEATSHLLKKHILFMHYPENLFRCYNCEYAAMTKHNLRCHILRKHINRFIYTCTICDRFKTKSKGKLERHVAVHKLDHLKNQVNKNDLICQICRTYFSKNERDLKFHMSRVHAIKQVFSKSRSRSSIGPQK